MVSNEQMVFFRSAETSLSVGVKRRPVLQEIQGAAMSALQINLNYSVIKGVQFGRVLEADKSVNYISVVKD